MVEMTQSREDRGDVRIVSDAVTEANTNRKKKSRGNKNRKQEHVSNTQTPTHRAQGY
jgi:hypothetical protein